MGKHWADESEFGKSKETSDGLTSSCLKCRRERYRGKYKRGEYINGINRPDYTEMRHPDPAVMEDNVRNLTAKYAVDRLILKACGMSFKDNCVACDKVLNPRTA